MKKLIKKIREHFYWTDWMMVFYQIILALLAIVIVGMIVIIILGACGVIPMEGESSNSDWLNMFTTLKNCGIF